MIHPSERCTKEVRTDGMGFSHHRCYRKKWKGDFCKQHHPDTEKEKRKARQDKLAQENKLREAELEREWDTYRKARAYDAVMEWCLEQRRKPLVPEPIASASLTVRRILEETK